MISCGSAYVVALFTIPTVQLDITIMSAVETPKRQYCLIQLCGSTVSKVSTLVMLRLWAV